MQLLTKMLSGKGILKARENNHACGAGLKGISWYIKFEDDSERMILNPTELAFLASPDVTDINKLTNPHPDHWYMFVAHAIHDKITGDLFAPVYVTEFNYI
jgi:hypothetical protein